MTKLLTFLLGFYVSTMMRRWWSQICHLPNVENIALTVNSVVGPPTSEDNKGINLKVFSYFNKMQTCYLFHII